MGNSLRSHESLAHVRGWTREQIDSVFDTLRRKKMTYSMTKEEFARYFGGRNREAIIVFTDLDTDFDGRVDIFEVLVVLTIWSGTSWEEKQAVLFQVFDMMNKGFLKCDEIMLMATVIVQTVEKFVRVDKKFTKREAITSMVRSAFPPNQTKITLEQFQAWMADCEPFTQLKGFVQDHAARGQADSNESRMRVRIAAIEKHAAKIFERIERLHDLIPSFTDTCIDYVSAWGRRKRWDFLMQNARHLIMKLQQVSESMHSALADLEESLNEEEMSGGLSCIIDPHKRFKQEQQLIDLGLMQQQSQSDYQSITDLLKRLIELTEPVEIASAAGVEPRGGHLNVITEEEGEGVIDMAPPRVVESRNVMKQLQSDMAADIESKELGQTPDTALANRSFASQMFGAHAESTSSTPRALDQQLGIADGAEVPGDAEDGDGPTLVAISDFDPPSSHQAQMLKLFVGDLVTVIGQDGRGWWYGRKQNGKEGWFPPSYVQLKAAHFTSGGS